MNKICGQSCEHNKSGVCQISVCDKRMIIYDKTEIKHLSQSYYDLHEKYYKLQQENQKYKEVIDRAIEYLTSYSSIHTIQFGTENDSLNDIGLNKTLDEKTLNEMTNRYLKVHDKLLEILKEVE